MIIKYKDEDLIGKRFGRLTIEYLFTKLNNKNARVRFCHCICDCGKEFDTIIYRLLNNSTKSCGCYGRENSAIRLRNIATRHNLRDHKLYNVWSRMTQRCYNIKCKDYNYYGARGIIMHPEWKDNPEKFINWCLENGWKDDLTIDRIDVNGNYEPNNIRFVDRHIQSVNQCVRKDNSSGYKGVKRERRCSTWRADIKVNGKYYYLGSFKSKREAVEARNKFIIENGLTEYKIQEWKGE